MLYPVIIEEGMSRTVYSVMFPDLPGCFSNGDNLDNALSAAADAAIVWIKAAREANFIIPAPSTFPQLVDFVRFQGLKLMFVEVCLE